MIPVMIEGEGFKAFLTRRTLTIHQDDVRVILRGPVFEAIRAAIMEDGNLLLEG